MSFFDWGNPPINSTVGPATNPSTATLVAELDSTQLGTAGFRSGEQRIIGVTAILGCSTTALWQVEHATSTALSATADPIYIQTPSGQSGQYFVKFTVAANDRIRARLNSSITGTATAFLSGEYVT